MEDVEKQNFSFNASVNSSNTQTPPPPPPHPFPTSGYCGEFVKFCTSRGWAFANPGAIPELLTRMQFLIRI